MPSMKESDGQGVTVYLVAAADIRPVSPNSPENPNGVPLIATCRASASHAANRAAVAAITRSPAPRHQAAAVTSVSSAAPAASGTNAPRTVNGLNPIMRGASTASGVTASQVSTATVAGPGGGGTRRRFGRSGVCSRAGEDGSGRSLVSTGVPGGAGSGTAALYAADRPPPVIGPLPGET
jgi:hypothetical protein